MRSSQRLLTRTGFVAGRPALATLHLSGAWIANPDRAAIQAEVLRFTNSQGRQMTDLTQRTPAQLLRLYAGIGPELRRREIVRSENITGDVAEYLFCLALGLTPRPEAHIDAVGPDGKRYQIKGRRLTPSNQSRELGAIRDMAGQHFDFLGGLLFDESFGIYRAALVPHDVVMQRATFVVRSNSHKFLLLDDVWDVPGVRDVTDELVASARTLDPDPPAENDPDPPAEDDPAPV
jgi:hypothetical protein